MRSLLRAMSVYAFAMVLCAMSVGAVLIAANTALACTSDGCTINARGNCSGGCSGEGCACGHHGDDTTCSCK